MVQKEVKKKTKIYGAAAILSAIILVTMIYSLGSTPIVYPPNQTPSVTGMKTFSSVEELRDYINYSQARNSYAGGPLDSQFFGELAPIPAPVAQASGTGNSLNEYWTGSTDTYSTTNIQVAGVDEADTVKTDGQYIYTVSTTQNLGYFSYGYNSGTSNAICIVKADPHDPQLVSKISLGNDTEPAGLFLSQDGSKLAVLASSYQYVYDGGPIPYPATRSGDVTVMPMLPYYQANVYTFIYIYDVTDKANPVLARNFTVSGSYFDSRMIGNYVYAVVSQPAVVYDTGVILPTVYNGASESSIGPDSIYYADMVKPDYYTFTSFFGINILDDQQLPTNMTVMMGGASTMYVSTDNMYVTYPTWTSKGEFTSIYRVSINGAQLSFEAEGNVPGYVINKYAMDEYNGYFRVATNWYDYSVSSKQINNVYVLNSTLGIVGKLEGLAENENLHSVRFMGDKCYLVTFKTTDPLFVIDVSRPENPKVLGLLKIPGYSDYLHPYDETHLIGVGKETVDSQTANFAWYQGLKLALFDVSNVNSPVQLSKYVIGDRGTDSIALTDPKAFLFDKAKSLLVVPVSLAIVDNSTGQAQDGSYGQTVWQGAYVFSISLDGGFVLKGVVTHLDPSLLNSRGYLKDSTTYWTTQNNWITRSLYIGNTLYTVSNSEVKLNNLTDMTQIGQVNLS
jgi:inhibitor of cysteine peptidase